MFHPLERQGKPAYERPLDLPSSSDTVREEKYASEQADDRVVQDGGPVHYIDSEGDELEGVEAGAGGPEDLGNRVEWGTRE